MTLEKFLQERDKLIKDASIADIRTSPDFQCNQTDGFPTSHCVYLEKGKAWLSLNENLSEDGEDISQYQQGCANFGIRDCYSADDYNAILKELGEDAIRSASLSNEEIEEMEATEQTEDFSMNSM